MRDKTNSEVAITVRLPMPLLRSLDKEVKKKREFASRNHAIIIAVYALIRAQEKEGAQAR